MKIKPARIDSSSEAGVLTSHHMLTHQCDVSILKSATADTARARNLYAETRPTDPRCAYLVAWAVAPTPANQLEPTGDGPALPILPAAQLDQAAVAAAAPRWFAAVQ